MRSAKFHLKNWFLVKSLVWMIRGTGWTSKTIHLNEKFIDSLEQNYILATWHQNIYFSCWLLKNRKLGSLISESKDGEMIARVVEHFSFIPIRGSSSYGGSRALREIVAYLKGPLPAAITPDGPLGPRCKVQPGVIMISKMSGAPIIPWCYEALDQWTIHGSWDQHKIPKPFTIAVSVFGSPIYVPASLTREEIEEYCVKLGQVMVDLQKQAAAEIKKTAARGSASHFCQVSSVVLIKK